ncbi:VOC family protein [Metabacillus herbersteinensis]|uniref:VOC family protein n=1 Tax=Metabacillus herbersteinensis TaxID=283816 RepID=A0ABV6GBC3_9BACI
MKTGILHHIEINVANLDRSVRFWDWLLKELGYEEFQNWEQGRSWKLGDTYLVFVQTEERFLDVPYHRCRSGLNHLAFHAESTQHVELLTNKLREKGVNILYNKKHPFAGGEHHFAAYFEDPDRMKVEIVATYNR